MPERSANVIEIRGLVNRFGEQVLHDGLDLDIRRGEVIGVVGGSGTGKSVLLRTIIGLNRPAEGDIRVLGHLTRELDDEGYRTVDGAQSDEPLDPAMIPVIEAGGGVAEGFEQAEALLVDHASDAPDDGTDRILADAFGAEAEDDRGVYGEADDEHPGGADR